MANFKLYITLSILSILQSQSSAFLEFLDPDDNESAVTIAKIIHTNFEIWKKCDRICAEKFKSSALSYKSCNRSLSFIIICLYDGGKSIPLVPAGSLSDKDLDRGATDEDTVAVPTADIGIKVLPGEEVPIVSQT